MTTAMLDRSEPTFDPHDLAPSLAELGAHFFLMAADFQRISTRAMTLAATVQNLQATGEPITAELYAEMDQIANLFCEGATADYDTDPIGVKCNRVGSLVDVLSGKLVYDDGSFESPEGPEG